MIYETNNIVYWRSIDNRYIPLKYMSNEHVEQAFNKLNDKKYKYYQIEKDIAVLNHERLFRKESMIKVVERENPFYNDAGLQHIQPQEIKDYLRRIGQLGETRQYRLMEQAIEAVLYILRKSANAYRASDTLRSGPIHVVDNTFVEDSSE